MKTMMMMTTIDYHPDDDDDSGGKRYMVIINPRSRYWVMMMSLDGLLFEYYHVLFCCVVCFVLFSLVSLLTVVIKSYDVSFRFDVKEDKFINHYTGLTNTDIHGRSTIAPCLFHALAIHALRSYCDTSSHAARIATMFYINIKAMWETDLSKTTVQQNEYSALHMLITRHYITEYAPGPLL